MNTGHNHPETAPSSHGGSHPEANSSNTLRTWFSSFKDKIFRAIGISDSPTDLGKWQNEVFRLGNGTPEGDTKAVILLTEMLKDPHRSELAKKIATQAKPFAKASAQSLALYKAALAHYAPELHELSHSVKKAA